MRSVSEATLTKQHFADATAIGPSGSALSLRSDLQLPSSALPPAPPQPYLSKPNHDHHLGSPSVRHRLIATISQGPADCFVTPRSTCTRRVLVVAHEFGGEEGQAWEFKTVDVNATKTPEWLSVIESTDTVRVTHALLNDALGATARSSRSGRCRSCRTATSSSMVRPQVFSRTCLS